MGCAVRQIPQVRDLYPKIFVYSAAGMTEHRLHFWRVVYIKK